MSGENVINTILGNRYRITEQIGSGGMADVYKAVDETLGRSVAVKIMHKKYASDANFAARFRQEAQAAANLSSPNIVNIYDWGQDGDTYYIVMEYVRGTDLKKIIQEKGSLSSKQTAEIGAQVCSALAVAHGYDIIHRDIKPHNIMVTPDGGVKVMDFGIARAGNTTMTQTDSVLGTAHYVSPEQAQGKHLNAASDLYSLGIVLYEASCGVLPFNAETPVAVALKQVNEQPVRPSKHNPTISPALETVIGKALIKDPRLRYTSAELMRRDLLNVVRGATAADAHTTTSVPSAMASGATTVMPAVAGASALDKNGTFEGPRGYGESNGPLIPEPKQNRWWIWLIAVILLAAAIAGVYFAYQNAGNSIPDVTNKPLAEAKATLEAAGFVIGDVTEENSDTVEPGSVIRQTPASGVSMKKGTTVSLVISLGTKMAEVPEVTGLTEAEARQLITDAGFSANPQPAEFDEKVESGKIISQDPEPGQQLAVGSAISYIPSKGIETSEVPDLSGKNQADAEALIKKAGFKSVITESFSSTVPEGNVISQNPSAGLMVNKGSKIAIVVSKGVEVVNIKVPDVIGSPVGTATSLLKKDGFKVILTYEPHAENNFVLEQSIDPGTVVEKGTTISLLIDAKKP